MIDVVVSGAAGRLGSRIALLATEASDLRVRAGLVRPGSEVAGQDLGAVIAAGRLLGVPALSRAEDAIHSGVVLAECAPRQAAIEHAAMAASAGAPVLIATTGFNRDEDRALRSHGLRVPILIAPNLSLGVATLIDLVSRAAAALPSTYHIELVEMHHAKKRDAPSGTAWALARAALEARGQDVERDAILARAGEIGPRGEREIGIQSVRGGGVIGEHTIYFISETERLELTHRAETRDTFASGALAAIRFLGASDRAPGVYAMKDVLGR